MKKNGFHSFKKIDDNTFEELEKNLLGKHIHIENKKSYDKTKSEFHKKGIIFDDKCSIYMKYKTEVCVKGMALKCKSQIELYINYLTDMMNEIKQDKMTNKQQIIEFVNGLSNMIVDFDMIQRKNLTEDNLNNFNKGLFVRDHNIGSINKNKKTNEIKECFGYYLVKSKSDNKWNIFYTSDSAFELNNIDKYVFCEKYFELENKYNRLEKLLKEL